MLAKPIRGENSKQVKLKSLYQKSLVKMLGKEHL